MRSLSRGDLSRDQPPLVLRVHKEEQHQIPQRLRRSRTIRIWSIHTDNVANHLTRYDFGRHDPLENLKAICRVLSEDRFPVQVLSPGLEIGTYGNKVELDLGILV